MEQSSLWGDQMKDLQEDPGSPSLNSKRDEKTKFPGRSSLVTMFACLFSHKANHSWLLA